MIVPLSVAPAQIKKLACGKSIQMRRFSMIWGSSQNLENIEIEFLPSMTIEKIPYAVKFAIGPIRYYTNYTLNWNTLIVRRDFVGNLKKVICDDIDDRDLEKFSAEMNRK